MAKNQNHHFLIDSGLFGNLPGTFFAPPQLLCTVVGCPIWRGYIYIFASLTQGGGPYFGGNSGSKSDPPRSRGVEDVPPPKQGEKNGFSIFFPNYALLCRNYAKIAVLASSFNFWSQMLRQNLPNLPECPKTKLAHNDPIHRSI